MPPRRLPIPDITLLPAVLAGEFQSAASRPRVLVNFATGVNPKIAEQESRSQNTDGAPLLQGPPAELESADGKNAVFQPQAELFLNRDHVLREIPEALRDATFLRGNLESARAVCQKPGIVYAATATEGRNADSRAATLEEHGFELAAIPEFLLFGNDLCSIYQKRVEADEVLDFGKWVVLIMPQNP